MTKIKSESYPYPPERNEKVRENMNFISRLRQEDQEFKASLGYMTLCQKQNILKINNINLIQKYGNCVSS
jgi:hypothetical protein